MVDDANELAAFGANFIDDGDLVDPIFDFGFQDSEDGRESIAFRGGWGDLFFVVDGAGRFDGGGFPGPFHDGIFVSEMNFAGQFDDAADAGPRSVLIEWGVREGERVEEGSGAGGRDTEAEKGEDHVPSSGVGRRGG